MVLLFCFFSFFPQKRRRSLIAEAIEGCKGPATWQSLAELAPGASSIHFLGSRFMSLLSSLHPAVWSIYIVEIGKQMH